MAGFESLDALLHGGDARSDLTLNLDNGRGNLGQDIPAKHFAVSATAVSTFQYTQPCNAYRPVCKRPIRIVIMKHDGYLFGCFLEHIIPVMRIRN